MHIQNQVAMTVLTVVQQQVFNKKGAVLTKV